MSATIAALFVSKKGPYWNDSRFDAWDQERDARDYRGPLPVIAHPPCQRWCQLSALVQSKGGAHNIAFADSGCFASALQSVMLFGGVLEHPAHSHAFKWHGLVKPLFGSWQYVEQAGKQPGYWVTEVWQSTYGHKARKKTWLLYVGKNKPANMKWEKTPALCHVAGMPGVRGVGNERQKAHLSKAESIHTPLLFQTALVEIVSCCH